MCNLAGCATGCRLRNRTPGYATGRPDVLPESLPILLLNRETMPHGRLCNCNQRDFSSYRYSGGNINNKVHHQLQTVGES